MPHQVAELRVALETTGSEKEFYYAKLRDVEIFCQDEHIKGDPVRPSSPMQCLFTCSRKISATSSSRQQLQVHLRLRRRTRRALTNHSKQMHMLIELVLGSAFVFECDDVTQRSQGTSVLSSPRAGPKW